MKKKDSIIKGIVNSVLPVILAFAFGAIIIAAIGESPLETYGVLIRKSLLTEKGFIPADLIKMVIAMIIGPEIRKRLGAVAQ